MHRARPDADPRADARDLACDRVFRRSWPCYRLFHPNDDELHIGHVSLTAAFIGVFIVGSSLSLIIPQCLFSVSKCLDPTSSSAATTLVCCLAPGAGGFLPPVAFTNLTTLAGPSTNFRLQFVGVHALAVGIAEALGTLHSEKRAAGALLSKD